MDQASSRPTTATSERTRNRNTELGDRACFCAQCGWSRRYYPGVIEPPADCPECEGAIIGACGACGTDVLSTMAVRCDVCDAPLRGADVAGVRIARPKRLPLATVQNECGCDSDHS